MNSHVEKRVGQAVETNPHLPLSDAQYFPQQTAWVISNPSSKFTEQLLLSNAGFEEIT